MTLKTLKDFSNLDGVIFDESGTKAIEYYELRQEAIKRYKLFSKKTMIIPPEADNNDILNHILLMGRMEEIKEFYNLTDEELK